MAQPSNFLDASRLLKCITPSENGFCQTMNCGWTLHSSPSGLCLQLVKGLRRMQGYIGRALSWNFRALTMSSTLALAVLAGCSLLSGGGSNGTVATVATEDVGEAQFAVKIVPNDVQCIQVTAAGSRTLTSSFDVTPNQAAQLSMPGLPSGVVTFTATAFSTPCSQVTASSIPGWSSAAVTGQVVAGGVIQVTLVMSQSGSANIGIEFPGSAGAGGSAGGGSGGSGGSGNAGAGGNAGSQAGIWDSSKWNNALWQ